VTDGHVLDPAQVPASRASASAAAAGVVVYIINDAEARRALLRVPRELLLA